MTISLNPGVSQQAMQGPSGSSGNTIGNPADSTTTASQGATIIDLQDIAPACGTSSNVNDAIEYPSLPSPTEAALEGQIDATLTKLETMDMEAVFLDMGAILSLMVKSAQEMRTTGRMDRAANLAEKLDKLLHAAEEIKNAGEDRYKAAMISGAIKIASGAIQITASTVALKYSISSANAGPKTSAGATLQAKADFATGIARGLESMMDGISTIVTADINLDAAMAEEQKAIYEALAQGDESKSNEANEAFSMAMDILRKVMETLQSQIDAARNMNSKITGNMI